MSYNNHNCHRPGWKRQAIRNLKSAGTDAIYTSCRTADRTVAGVIRQLSTPAKHESAYQLGFWLRLQFLLIDLVAAILSGALMFILIAVGIPLFISGVTHSVQA
jgi:hypothetical protein